MFPNINAISSSLFPRPCVCQALPQSILHNQEHHTIDMFSVSTFLYKNVAFIHELILWVRMGSFTQVMVRSLVDQKQKTLLTYHKQKEKYFHYNNKIIISYSHYIQQINSCLKTENVTITNITKRYKLFPQCLRIC